MAPIPHPLDSIDYPDSDGRPVAESDLQREPLLYAVSALRQWYRAREDVYVSGTILLYYEEGNPKASVAPDILVVLGAPKHDRRSYKLWQEPKVPDFVLEVTSKTTVSEDQGIKRGLYAYLGVREYWQYDPTGDYLKPPLTGLRLADRNYWPIPVRTATDGSLSGDSAVLGLQLQVHPTDGFHLVDPASRTPLPTYQESEQARLAAEQQLRQAQADAESERALRLAAEERIRALEAKLRGDG